MIIEEFDLPEIDFSESAGLQPLTDEEFADVLGLRVQLPTMELSSPVSEFYSPLSNDPAPVWTPVSSPTWQYESPSSSFSSRVYPAREPLSIDSPPAPIDWTSSPPLLPLTEAELQAHLFAAACRYTYRLDYLTPVALVSPLSLVTRYSDLPRDQRNQVFQFLTTRSDVVTDSQGHARWMLRDAERRVALATLIGHGLAQTAVAYARQDAMIEQQPSSPLASPPRETSAGIEETLWSAIGGTSPDLHSQSRRQLLLTQRVSSWLYGANTAVPAPEVVARALARETLLQPFRHLCGFWQDGTFVSTFRGRDEERARINDYLRVLPSSSSWDFVKVNFTRLADSA